jgi:Ca-activated chloride channel family protein
VLVLAAASVGWLDPHEDAREGNRLFAAGRYEEAAKKYNEALVDDPDSAVLHFNLGDAAYKEGKYTDALNAFQQVHAAEDDAARAARVAYNVGNTKYRLGAAAEASDPQAALGLWAEALVAYRRAMGAAPGDVDAKFNHEFVERKIAELKKKLEEQKQKEGEQLQEQQEQQEQPQQQEGEKRQEEKEAGSEEKAGEQERAQEQAAPEAEQGGAQQQQAAGGGAEEGEMAPAEAAALLDSQRDEEVRPDEITRTLRGAAVAEPAMDW